MPVTSHKPQATSHKPQANTGNHVKLELGREADDWRLASDG
jgi:hypothetical protein